MRTYALEMMLATLMVTCGFVLVWPGDTFAMAHYGIMKKYIAETPGGLVLVVIGLLRWAAILRNGHGRYTPIPRIIGCCVGCGFWLTLAVTAEVALIINDEIAGPPLLLAVASTAAIFEIYCSMRGGEDASILDSLRLREWRRSSDDAGDA